MKILKVSPAKATQILKERPNRERIEQFKAQLKALLDRVSNKSYESEEHHKNSVSDFLKNTFYAPQYEVNTKGKEDLVVHIGATSKHDVGILFETKTPLSREMMSLAKPNVKALQQLILYYLRERFDDKNINVKHLIATDIFNWFVFDESLFHKHFYGNARLKNIFEQSKDAKKGTAFFYEEAAKVLDTLDLELPCIVFDLRDYRKYLGVNNLGEVSNLADVVDISNVPKADETTLIALYKVLSPSFLLKLPVLNDANSLDKNFYGELLHIIGLEEVKDGSKKVIRRKVKSDEFSLIENTITKLRNKTLRKLPNALKYGKTVDEQLENVALELCITWINRVLFLKLLEAQLIKYNRNDAKFRFMTPAVIHDFDRLNKLFFEVLAIHPDNRTGKAKTEFSHIPYLNSSLFERTPDLEETVLEINQLDDDEHLPMYPQSVLFKNEAFKKEHKSLPTVDYLLRFLDAYDFAAEANNDIQEQAEDKKLINASVLGLIFEKINGYKDGSFFTPAFVTMYMCRESIRRAVVQKFKESGLPNFSTIDNFDDLKDAIIDRKHANSVVNALKICDPAVGSGHFLVSALNEIVAIKSDLGILEYRNGKLVKGFKIEVVNDELSVFDEDEEQIFEYRLGVKGGAIADKQLVQEMLFHEKQLIIENCLFGVDINPNSVKICRLRLWIELLKNAFYTEGSSFRHLETLPNIDINIKEGNSLISRFKLDEDLSDVFKKQGFSYKKYRSAVEDYKTTNSKDAKRELELFIGDIKEQFKAVFNTRIKEYKELSKFKGQLIILQTQGDLFGGGIDKIEEDRLTKLVAQTEQKVNDIKHNVVYNNAFEWRFEFPEVLDTEGSFVGFDVIIGNPPYVFARDNFDNTLKKYFSDNYQVAQYQVNLFFLFIEKTNTILRNEGEFSLIVPNSMLMISSAQSLRKYLLEETSLHEIINLMGYSFDGVNVETVIFSSKKGKNDGEKDIDIYVSEDNNFVLSQTRKQKSFMQNAGFEFNVFANDESNSLTEKLNQNSVILDNLVKIKAGLKAYEVGKGNPKQIREDVTNRIYDYTYKFDDNTYSYLEGKDVAKYLLKWSGTYLKYGGHLASPRTFDLFNGKKIIIREIAGKYPTSIIATYSEDIYLFNMSNIAIIEKVNASISLKYILGILNSKLMSFYFMKNTAKSVRQMFPKIILEDLRKFPIKDIVAAEQAPLIALVDAVLTSKQTDATVSTAALEREIDVLVYGLYGLTDAEIAVIEGGV